MAEAPTQTPKAPAKADPKKLDRTVRHLGTFTNFRGAEYAGYLEYKDDGETTRGFALYSEDGKEFKPGLLVMNVAQLETARVKFRLSGKTQPLPKAEK